LFKIIRQIGNSKKTEKFKQEKIGFLFGFRYRSALKITAMHHIIA
jgi:hypothetical protein